VEIEKKETKYSSNRIKPSLFEMIVKTGNFFYAVLFHEDHGGTICETPLFIQIAAEFCPCNPPVLV